MQKVIKLAQDTIETSELEQLSKWIVTSSQLTKGPLTVEFEKAYAAYTGCKYAVFVNSGSSANLLMAYALLEGGFLKNKKVVVPAISWITTLSPFIQLGFEIFLCDGDQNDLGIDVDHFERLCREHDPALIIPVHVLGHPNKMDQINAVCEKYGVLLIEDACEALGSEYKGVKTGNLGLAGSFSFYYGHHISTIEGGIVTTNDNRLYNIMLSIRSHGWSRDLEPSFKQELKSEFSDIDEIREHYSFYYPGFNFRSTDLNAFLGLSQIKKMDAIAQHRQSIFAEYERLLGDKFWKQSSDYSTLSAFAYGMVIENRLEVFKKLKEAGVETRPLICGSMGRQPFWEKKFGATYLPVADVVHDYGIYLPIHYSITLEDVKHVAGVIIEHAIPKSIQ